MDKRTKKNFYAFVILIIVSAILSFFMYLDINNYFQVGLIWIFPLITGIFLFFNISVSRIFWFKPYFASKTNFLTSKEIINKQFDLPKELLFEKLIEVVNKSCFKIKKTDKNTGDIFATSSISWHSWGENIYISIVELNGKSNVEFISVCIFGVYDWGKNERNLEKILHEFENSLTI